MEWISGTGRDSDGRLCVETQGLDGKRALADIGTLRAELAISGGVRRKVVLPLHEMRVGDTRAYLTALGLGGLDAEAQRVYETTVETGNLVIPAQLLVFALFCSDSQSRQMLIRPWGQSLRWGAVAQDNRLLVRATPNRMFDIRPETPGALAKMEWAMAYPSAAGARGSVYRNALDGRFDMTMPNAFATVSVRIKQVGDQLLATRVQLVTLTADENPHEFAMGAAKGQYVFFQGVASRPTHGKASAPSGDSRVAPTHGHRVEKLSDAAWSRIEPLIVGCLASKRAHRPGRSRIHSLRTLVDMLFLKLGTPYSWSKCPGDSATKSSASALLTKLTRGGVWDQIVLALPG